MNGGSMATCPTISWGRTSVCHIDRQLYWKRKGSFGTCVKTHVFSF